MRPLEGNYVVCADSDEELSDVENLLQRWGCDVRSVKTIEGLNETLATQPVDLVVLAVCRSCCRALDFLPPERNQTNFPPFVVVACSQDVDLYLEAMKRGAADCIARPINENEFARILSRVLLHAGRHADNGALAMAS